MPDGIIQAMRVGATYGLASKYLARSDSSKLGLLGSGWQAKFQVAAAAAVHNLELVKVYSPNPEHRDAICARDERAASLERLRRIERG